MRPGRDGSPSRPASRAERSAGGWLVEWDQPAQDNRSPGKNWGRFGKTSLPALRHSLARECDKWARFDRGELLLDDSPDKTGRCQRK